jgi:hypothetical protein
MSIERKRFQLPKCSQFTENHKEVGVTVARWGHVLQGGCWLE